MIGSTFIQVVPPAGMGSRQAFLAGVIVACLKRIRGDNKGQSGEINLYGG